MVSFVRETSLDAFAWVSFALAPTPRLATKSRGAGRKYLIMAMIVKNIAKTEKMSKVQFNDLARNTSVTMARLMPTSIKVIDLWEKPLSSRRWWI